MVDGLIGDEVVAFSDDDVKSIQGKTVKMLATNQYQFLDREILSPIGLAFSLRLFSIPP